MVVGDSPVAVLEPGVSVSSAWGLMSVPGMPVDWVKGGVVGVRLANGKLQAVESNSQVMIIKMTIFRNGRPSLPLGILESFTGR